MQITELKKMAKNVGVKVPAGKVGKMELVRQIQTAEGNFPCFATADGYCDQSNCCFRYDCLTKDF